MRLKFGELGSPYRKILKLIIIMWLSSEILITPCFGTFHRTNLKMSERNLKYRTAKDSNGQQPQDDKANTEYDTIMIRNYIRDYVRGPVNNEVAFFTHDVFATYVGPAPKDHPVHFVKLNENERRDQPTQAPSGSVGEGQKQVVRIWAMFDIKNGHICKISQIQNYGETAIFTCPKDGIYRAYARECDLNLSNETDRILPQPEIMESEAVGRPTFVWAKVSRDKFNLFHYNFKAKDGSVVPPPPPDVDDDGPSEELEDCVFMKEIDTASFRMRDKMEQFYKGVEEGRVATSDPVIVKPSYFCYYWFFILKEIARVGYLGNEVIPPKRNSNDTSYLLLELRIWVGEPGAVSLSETDAHIGPHVISSYSKVITNRFHDTGLFPCLRKAHKVIEVVREISYVDENDQTNPFNGAPHWLAVLKIHTDRLISTLLDVTFTISSRQNTGSFHCFVGDTKVALSMREFEFVPQRKLERGAINVEASNIWFKDKGDVKHTFKHVVGHGTHYIGGKHSKLYQPGSNRSDMIIFNNPCVEQEFAFAVGGSLYVAEGFLRRGLYQARKVVLPDFTTSNTDALNAYEYREFQWVTDVSFTPTHLVVLLYDGSIVLHPTSVSLKGIGKYRYAHKYRPNLFVKRKWCAKTSLPKFSAMTIPMFSRSGSIIILQLYSVEGSVRMWVTPPDQSCIVEGHGFLAKTFDEDVFVNETEIHYQDYSRTRRTNQLTGLQVPPPPERPPPEIVVKDLDQEQTFLLNDGIIIDGGDPHFPEQLSDPARHLLGDNLTHYNDAVVYVLDKDNEKMADLMKLNGIINVAASEEKDMMGLYSVEFAAIEKQFIAAVKFKADQIPKEFGHQGKDRPFQMMITTITVTNFPFRVKLRDDIGKMDEELSTVIPFPGTILLRSKPFTLKTGKSRDMYEHKLMADFLSGDHFADYSPDLYVLNTAKPSYVINFGDIFLYTSLEGRYARPLHFYEWDVIDKRERENFNEFRFEPKPLRFNESSIQFNKTNTHQLYDAVVTEQGVISVLWRKEIRHYVKQEECDKDDKNVMYTQPVAIGSVITLEGLREVKPFFRHDNIVQRFTGDGTIIYGFYNTKPHSPFPTCRGTPEETKSDTEVCIDEGKDVNTTSSTDFGGGSGSGNATELHYCSKSVDAPCKDPAYLKLCGDDQQPPCLRLNKAICPVSDINADEDSKDIVLHGCPPGVEQDGQTKLFITECWPKHAPREELREIRFLGTSFHSLLFGNLLSVKSVHPEIPNEIDIDPITLEEREAAEPDICPFSDFKVYNVDFDYAEVGYHTRITGEISYFGTGIPTEADLIIEFEPIMGVIVDVAVSVGEQRGLTTIKKTVDIQFIMTDYQLLEQYTININEQLNVNLRLLDINDIRARENSQVFSLTLRPSIVNNHCKSKDYFKTVQLNVGCNTFSELKLIAEASPLVRMNWKDNAKLDDSELKWEIDGDNLYIPRGHVYYKQLTENVFNCTYKGSKCKIPYFDLFEKENIYTVSYRDSFYPKFEQFLTVSTRLVTGNVVIYDLMGSQHFNLTLNALEAGCVNTGNFWYDRLLNTTGYIEKGATEHETIYKYFINCFDLKNGKHISQQLSDTTYHLHNLTNNNEIRFRRQRNKIFVFRAVVVNTENNRFSYCKQLETFFMVRVTGIPIPRQGLPVWAYLLIILFVFLLVLASYFVFHHFYSWKLHTYRDETSERDELGSSAAGRMGTGGEQQYSEGGDSHSRRSVLSLSRRSTMRQKRSTAYEF